MGGAVGRASEIEQEKKKQRLKSKGTCHLLYVRYFQAPTTLPYPRSPARPTISTSSFGARAATYKQKAPETLAVRPAGPAMEIGERSRSGGKVQCTKDESV